MNEQAAAVNNLAAVFCIVYAVVCVNTVFNTPIAAGACTVPAQAAQLKEGSVFQKNAVLQLDIGLGNNLELGGVVANATEFLEEFINAVKNAAVTATNNIDALVLARKSAADLERFFIESGVNSESNGEAALLNVNAFLLQLFCKLLNCISLAFRFACRNGCAFERKIRLLGIP
jgi:hypothetical protein